MFTYSHANTPLSQSERAYYLTYFIMTNGTPFTYLVELFISLTNCCKCIVFRIWMWITKPERFFDFFTTIQLNLSTLLCIVTDRNDKFPYPFIHFNWWNPTLSYTWRLKKVPLSGVPLGIIPLPSLLYVSIFAPFRLKKREKNSSGGTTPPPPPPRHLVLDQTEARMQQA